MASPNLLRARPKPSDFLTWFALSAALSSCAHSPPPPVPSAGAQDRAAPTSAVETKQTPAPEPVLKPEESLTAVLNQGLNGLTSLSVEERQEVFRQAQDWAPERRERRRRSAQGRPSRASLKASVKAALRDGALDALESAPVGMLRKVLSKVPKLDPLDSLTQRVLSGEGCTNPNLAFVLAGEWENRFPDEKSLSQAIALYTRAARCGKGDTEIRAGYRLGLIQVWKGDCKSAIEGFDHVLGQSESLDLHSRSFYWKAQCEQRLGLPAAGTQAKAQLLAMFPFSYHVLLIHWPKMDIFQSWGDRKDSQVKMRSSKVPELNEALALIEAWVELKKREKIAAFIPSIQPFLDKAEPQVQLYYTALLERGGLYVPKFKELAVLLKTYPEMRSRAALQLLYPSQVSRIRYPDDPDQRLVESLIRQESAFDPRARSRVGAMGLMQLMPRTARLVAGVRPRQLWEPSTNVKVGSRYLQNLIDRFHGDVELALAAYNAGPEKVENWVQRYPVGNRVLFLDLIPFKETREYVASIARNFVWYSIIYGHDAEQSRALAAGAANAITPISAGTPVGNPPANTFRPPEELFQSLRSIMDTSRVVSKEAQTVSFR